MKFTIRLKLLAGFLFVGLASLAILGVLDYIIAGKTLKDLYFQKLTAIRETKRQHVQSYFEQVRGQIFTLSEDRMMVDAMREFEEAYRSLTKTSMSSSMQDYLLNFYNNEYLRELKSALGAGVRLEDYWPDSMEAQILQYQYLANNLRPDKQKDALVSVGGVELYDRVHAKYHQIIRDYKITFGYYDIFLIDTTGNIIYSVSKEAELGTNLVTGPYRKTNLGRLFRAASNAGRSDFIKLVDYERYAPSYAAPASFIASPIFDGTEQLGVLVFQMPIHRINNVMTGNRRWEEEGLGSTGETYIVGADYLMRSDSRFLIEEPAKFFERMQDLGVDANAVKLMKKYLTSILLQRVRTKSTEDALWGGTNTQIVADYRGEQVLSSYSPLDIPDVKWAILSEIDTSEAFAQVYAVRTRVFLLALVIAVLVLAFSLILSGKISMPAQKLMHSLEDLGKGNLSKRVLVESSDEIGDMAGAFNRMAEALEATTVSRDYFNSVVTSMTDLLIVVSVSMDTQETRIKSINRAAASLLGYEEDELVGSPVERIFVRAEDALIFKGQDLKELAEHASVRGRELAYLTKDGREIPVLFSSSLMFDEDQRFTGIVTVAQDIAERKKAEERMRLSAKVFDSSREAIVVTDLNAIIVDVNKAFSEITGYQRDELIGKNPSVMKSDRHPPEFYVSMWDSIIQTGIWEGEIWDRKKSGEIYPKWLSIATVPDEHGKPVFYAGIFSDLTTVKKNEYRINLLTNYDALTKLPNKILFMDLLKRFIEEAAHSRHPVAVMFLDLDDFKIVNDSLGHAEGDRLLVEVARRLPAVAGEGNIVARFGGDDFAMAVSSMSEEQDVARMFKSIKNTLGEPFEVGGRQIHISASMGIALYPSDGEDVDTLMRNADIAMFKAKGEGHEHYKFYDEDMNREVSLRLELETSLRQAIDRDELKVFYQPKVDIRTGRLMGMEALVRWQHPVRGIITPVDFIPLAEKTGLIIPIGKWVLRTACMQNKAWQDAGYRPMRVAVNLSARQFYDKGLSEMVMEIMKEASMQPQWLELELTESIIMHDVSGTMDTLNRLKSMGIHLTVDDFGTGYSSLSYLKQFSIDSLKIDQSFVRAIAEDAGDQAIVKAVIALARSLKLEVVAEGVETKEHLDFLKQHDCDIGQGYYFSKPITADDFREMLDGGNEMIRPYSA